jgi:hypothetical protein
MDSNHSSEWSEADIEKLISSLANEIRQDTEKEIAHHMASNAAIESGKFPHPLTLEYLTQMKEDFDKQFPEPLKFKNGADMSRATFNLLKIGIVPRETNGSPTFATPLNAIDVHFVESVPYGKIEECSCKERNK